MIFIVMIALVWLARPQMSGGASAAASGAH